MVIILGIYIRYILAHLQRGRHKAIKVLPVIASTENKPNIPKMRVDYKLRVHMNEQIALTSFNQIVPPHQDEQPGGP